MKNKLLFICISLFIVIPLEGISKRGSLKITILIDTGILNEWRCNELSLRVLETSNLAGKGRVESLKLDSDGYAEIELKSESFTYISFEMIYNGNKFNAGALYPVSFPERMVFHNHLKEAYLFENGDSVNVSIKKDGVLLFSGIGSEKLNCQYQIYTTREPIGSFSRVIDLLNSENYSKSLELKHEVLELLIQVRLKILESYRSQLSDNIYELIYTDAISAVEYERLYTLNRMCGLGKGKGLSAVRMYYNKYLKNDYFQNVDTSTLVSSAYYADMLFVKEFCFFQLFNQNGAYFWADSFEDIYKKLKLSYAGDIRDKLLLISFEKLFRIYSSEQKQFIEEALSLIKNIRYKSVLTEFRNSHFSAYAFELMDAKNRLHKLDDYRGKIIVMDFWYTGCEHCIDLNTAMAPIIEKYKNNKNIVFITVSIDKDKRQWENSVSTLKYTSEKTIDLYTNGQGARHPMIRNYNFSTFPQQIIIGPNGELISTNPPRVDIIVKDNMVINKTETLQAKTNSQKFIDILNKTLQEVKFIKAK